jgi:uncharacterized membrane protein
VTVTSGRRATTWVALAIVLGSLAATLAVGLAVKAPCASGNWSDGRQYTRFCYSDIVPLYGTEQLSGGRLPYVNKCTGTGTCDEYPVLTMYLMRLAATPVSTYAAFFYANAVLLGLCALAVALCLYLLVGYRALLFAAAPTLLIYGFLNWDLLAVAAATAATLALLASDEITSGALLGVGAAAKFFPGLLAVPFGLHERKVRGWVKGLTLVGTAVFAWVVLNLPFALAARHSWETFFTFNKNRVADFDSMWYLACQHVPHFCPSVKTINYGSLVAFVGLSALVYALKARRHPDFPRWTFGLPLLIAFLLTNKVYSPQYSLWLLPWFALALPSIPLWISFELADVAVFLSRFAWFGALQHLHEPSIGPVHLGPNGLFQSMLLVRAAVLIAYLIWYVIAPAPDLKVEVAHEPLPATPALEAAA